MSVKVGSFTKSTNTSVPVDQAITGIGFKPWVVIFILSGATSADTLGDGFHQAWGIAARDAAGTITAGCTAGASEDNVASENASSYTAAKALAIVEWGESLLAEADMKSFDNDGFTLTWTTNNATAYIISYIAIGGSSITAAKIVGWDIPSSTGNKAVTGVGFQPECVAHLTNNPTSLATATASAYPCFGVMTAAGGQMALEYMERDAYASGLGYTYKDTDCCIFKHSTVGATDFQATFVSMDADGFTVNFSTAGAGEKAYSLCLNGGSYYIGSFVRATTSTNPLDQSVTGVGFQPEGLLFGTGRAALGGGSDTHLHIGATDGTAERCEHWQDDYNAATIDTKHYSTADKSILVFEPPPSASLYWAADIKTLNADGFTVTWTTINETSASEAAFWAFSGGAAAATGNPWYAYAQQ